jgi:hypothetical protein
VALATAENVSEEDALCRGMRLGLIVEGGYSKDCMHDRCWPNDMESELVAVVSVKLRLLGRLGRGFGGDSILLAVKGPLFVIEGSVSVRNGVVGGITFNSGLFATTIVVVLIELEGRGEVPFFEKMGGVGILRALQAVVDFATGSEVGENVFISTLACHC